MRFLDRVIKCAPWSSKVPVHQKHDHLYLPSRWVGRTLYRNKQRAIDFVEMWFEDSVSLYKDQNKQILIDTIKYMEKPSKSKLISNIFGLGVACFYYEFYKTKFRVNSLLFFGKPSAHKLMEYHDLKLPRGNISFYQKVRSTGIYYLPSSVVYNIYLDLGGTLAEKPFQLELMQSGFYLPHIKRKTYKWGFIHTSLAKAFDMVTEEDLLKAEQEVDYMNYLKELDYIKKTGKCRITHLF